MRMVITLLGAVTPLVNGFVFFGFLLEFLVVFPAKVDTFFVAAHVQSGRLGFSS
jgi:hypothetical protein